MIEFIKHATYFTKPFANTKIVTVGFSKLPLFLNSSFIKFRIN
ncbi:hypothetical protein [Bacillus sp. SI2]|nr:hypothetical protein [Bacillus sp. SI2]MDA2006784.1 hypothetical protein [Bacillus cereus]WNV17498.1 hypothetical protein RS401_14800 [Bacillus sp. SI2]